MESIIDIFNANAHLLVLISLPLSIGQFLTGLGTKGEYKVKDALLYLGTGYFIYLVSTPKSQDMVKMELAGLTKMNALFYMLIYIISFSLIEILITRIKRKLRKKKEQQHINERND